MVIGDSAVVVTPQKRPPQLDRLVESTAVPATLTDPRYVEDIIGPLEDSLGPADLQYGTIGAASSAHVRGPLPLPDPLVERVWKNAPPAERSEAGFEDDRMEAIFVALDGEQPLAASGYRRWPGGIAHMGVLTIPAARRRGLGRKASLAAAGHATDHGLLVQWRSLWSNDASRQLGQSLGLYHCGRQFSFLLRAG
ncbi:MAG TPA: GNAT family N-acetyltransferase [Acidimicrobiales bacterium]|nr:GNAT family N-acetyltransferase [Acidimicrobiales bacterium]